MRLPSRYAQRHDEKKSASYMLGLRAVFLHDAPLREQAPLIQNTLPFYREMNRGFMMENILACRLHAVFHRETIIQTAHIIMINAPAC
jgi:hypothetical protein